MEFLEKLGDFFVNITSFIDGLLKRLFGSSNERMIRTIGFERDKEGNNKVIPGSTLDRIAQLEPELEKLTDAELKETASKLRAKLKDGKTLDDILPDAFAAVREAGKRYLKMRHYDVQMVGGYILHHGNIAEMSTGEGKTLVATLPSFLNGLAGSVHVVTVNDYLALRDMEWMGPLHMGLGLTVGAIQGNMDNQSRAHAYSCDITYGTNNEFGFDYLRDNMKPHKSMQVQGPLVYAIVDEIDNILIDEARTPLIISGEAMDDVTRYSRAHKVAVQLTKGEDFEVKEKEHTCHLTDTGIRKAENLMGVDSFYTPGNMEWPHLIDNALRAIHLFRKDVEYVIEKGEVVIVDEHTGRKMYGRQWSDGLHQAVEAKEGVTVKKANQTLATITLQNYFKLYKKLSGMTGTAMTEANEFYKIYKLDVIAVPPNRPSKRKNYPDLIFRTQNEKWNAVVDEVRKVHKTGQPILVGTVSIEKSEIISNRLQRYGIDHQVLNAKNHEREAEFISQAGRYGKVTISTNMAGRGTDIILGGNPEYLAWQELGKTYQSRLDVPKAEWDEVTKRIADRENMKAEGEQVKAAGGLYVIGTERHDARRIDLQLRGRAGRQGDPGESRFFTSLDDDLMRIFAGDTVKSLLTTLGMKEGEAIESSTVTWQIEKAQKKREEFHFEQRKHLLEYDEVMDQQRKMVYTYRQKILDGENCRKLILDMIDKQLSDAIPVFLTSNYRWETIVSWADSKFGIDAEVYDIQNSTYDQIVNYLKEKAERQAEQAVLEKIEEALPKDDDEANWNWPSLSRWANMRFELNTNERELQKMSRDDMERYLIDRAFQAISRYKYDEIHKFLEPDFERQALCSYYQNQYGVPLTVTEIEKLDPNKVSSYLKQKLEDAYATQEVRFPVSVGMASFIGKFTGSEGFDREGMFKWAKGRFAIPGDINSIFNQSREAIAGYLMDQSREFLNRGEKIDQVHEKVEEYLGKQDDYEKNGFQAAEEKWDLLEEWAQRELSLDVDFSKLTKDERDPAHAEMLILKKYDEYYRPEFSHTEQSLILDVVDKSWKDHLYYMDKLKNSIGLMGYAQKDPKVEYKREGMKAFEAMWQRIGQFVTNTIFRVEEQHEYMGNLWRITSATHAAPDDASYASEPEPEMAGAAAEGGSSAPIKQIRNFNRKVGRNDPCPCGSGKKYKKCCGEKE